ncbi:hypothetical protein TYRP_002904 [Tyrophagus putrescentiae]|nr:hypothetical protein TYRP_002904 [Tyrophagus putrescentiae]
MAASLAEVAALKWKRRAHKAKGSGLALAEGRSGGRGDSHCNRTGRPLLPRVNGSQGQSIPAF